MFLIGITGGVGAGKSKILSILEEVERSVVLRADDLARELMEPGRVLNQRIAEAFSDCNIMDESGRLRTEVMAQTIFSDDEKRKRANSIIHPTVKEEILRLVSEAKESNKVDFFFLEAALLLEEHYDEICDEIWYVYASIETRTGRLAETRGYSLEKTKAIMASQLSEEDFRAKCQRIIDNDGKLWTAKEQLLDYVAKLQAK